MSTPAAFAEPVPAHPVAESAAMRAALAAAADVAPTPTTVLLVGEHGTGKELLARFIHEHSPRAAGPWVALSCAALAPDEDGAHFEHAAGGTLVLDEVGELPAPLQAKLLRVLQDHEGGDVRVIATTSRDLAALVRAGRFRSDLYYRLDVFPIALAPLRERPEDVLPLADRLLADAAAWLGRAPPALTEAARAALLEHPFPGNVRELRNLLERALVRSHGAPVQPAHLGLERPRLAPIGPCAPFPPAAAACETAQGAAAFPPGLPLDLPTLERLAIEEALRRVQGNRTHAARLLGIGLRTLRNKLRAWREAGLAAEPGIAPAPTAARALPVPPSLAAAASAFPAPTAFEEALPFVIAPARLSHSKEPV